MCEVGLLSDIFALCKLTLEDENHPLHETFQYLLERLSAQKLEPGDLRAFLRLGNPLSCDTSEGEQQPSQQSAFVPLSRIKTLGGDSIDINLCPKAGPKNGPRCKIVKDACVNFMKAYTPQIVYKLTGYKVAL